jgi:hypothetical protein
MTVALAAAIALVCTLALTIAGLGAAFILIPVFLALGIDLHTAMATALLLNAIAMAVAAVFHIRRGLVEWRLAMPMVITAGLLAPLGAWVSRSLDRGTLMWGFIGFLLFAAMMLVWYKPRERQSQLGRGTAFGLGMGIGAVAGFLGGLLGVGGGNIVVPALIVLGLEPRRASATSTLVIIVPSLTGFLAHAGLAHIPTSLVVSTGLATLVGAGVGSWLASSRLRGPQIKVVIASVLLLMAGKLTWDQFHHVSTTSEVPHVR